MFKAISLSHLFKFAVALLLTGVMSAGVSAPANAGAVQDWQRSVVKLVAKKQVYPREALTDSVEGKAKVQVTISRSGAITGFKVAEASGSTILDAEIPKLMSRIDPLPAPPAELSDSNLTFVLPLTWVLE